MTINWVRQQGRSGGVGKWHVLREERGGQTLPNGPSLRFALTICGQTLLDPFQIQVGVSDHRYRPGLLLPHNRNGAQISLSNTVLCERCLDLGWMLQNSNAL